MTTATRDTDRKTILKFFNFGVYHWFLCIFRLL